MGLFRRRRDDDAPVDMDERSPELGVKYKDLLLLGQLIQAGADLHQPRHVLYFLYAPDRATGLAMADEVGAAGFTTSAEEPLPDHPDDWPVRCETHAVLSPEVVRDNTDYFEALAERHGSLFDGWEAAAKP